MTGQRWVTVLLAFLVLWKGEVIGIPSWFCWVMLACTLFMPTKQDELDELERRRGEQ